MQHDTSRAMHNYKIIQHDTRTGETTHVASIRALTLNNANAVARNVYGKPHCATWAQHVSADSVAFTISRVEAEKRFNANLRAKRLAAQSTSRHG